MLRGEFEPTPSPRRSPREGTHNMCMSVFLTFVALAAAAPTAQRSVIFSRVPLRVSKARIPLLLPQPARTAALDSIIPADLSEAVPRLPDGDRADSMTFTELCDAMASVNRGKQQQQPGLW